MKFKIAFIGAGSVGFTRKLIKDLLSVPEFNNLELCLMDISEENLNMVYEIIKRDIFANDLHSVSISKTTNRIEAVTDAKYIINTVRVGGIDAFKLDIEIPLRYGIDQCVGDTLCAGGIMYGQRGINMILGLCEDINKYSMKNAILLNYSNPMVMMTWAANKFGQVKTIGLCHGVQNGINQIAEAFNIPEKEIDYVCAGINHQTWYVKLMHKGKDLTGDLLEAMQRHDVLSKQEKVRIDVLKNFGYYSTESNGHLSEYLPWYRKRPEELPDWISMTEWIHGETGGYLRVCTEKRNWFEEDFPKWLAEEPEKYIYENRSNEHGSFIIESLETGRCYRGHFNVINEGIISNLPHDAVVEVPGYVDATGINTPLIGDIPAGCAAICSQSISVQRLSVEAAVIGNEYLLKQAMLMDPLCGAVCNTDEIKQMTEEMLIAEAEWIPQYQETVDKLKKTFTKKINTREYAGAARKKVKSVEELRKDGKDLNVEAQAFRMIK